MKRLTLDMTAIRDATYEEREHHRDALRLLELAERGDVELGVPPQGSLADLRGQFGELAEQVQGLLARPGIVGLPQVARLYDVTFPGQNLLPSAYVEGFHEAWDAIAADWNGPGQRPGSSIGGTSNRTSSGTATCSSLMIRGSEPCATACETSTASRSMLSRSAAAPAHCV